MWICNLPICAVVMFATLAAENAMAQTRSGSGMSAFGSSSFGSSGFGSSFGSSGFGSSGFGSSFGSSGFGSSGFGSSFGSSGFGSSFGSSRSGSNNFVGRDANDMQAAFTQFSRSSSQFFNNMNRQMARANMPQRAVTTRNTAQPIRTQVQVAFDAPQPAADVVSKALQVRLAKIMSDHHMTIPVISVQNGTAVLSGVAKNDSERQVIATLVSFEPGVRSVRNEMTVADELPNVGTSSPSGS